jgi:hypothetical protein
MSAKSYWFLTNRNVGWYHDNTGMADEFVLEFDLADVYTREEGDGLTITVPPGCELHAELNEIAHRAKLPGSVFAPAAGSANDR